MPSRNVSPVEPIANAKFQASVPKNGPEMFGSVSTVLKFFSPTSTFQPWASRSPSAATKEPDFSSAVHVLPVSLSLTQSHPASYARTALPSYARVRPLERMAPSSVGTISAVIASLRPLACPMFSRV